MTDDFPCPSAGKTPPLLSRRTMLAGVGAGLALGLLAPALTTRSRAHAALATVATLPSGAPQRSLFAPEEQIFAGFLRIAAPLANDIVTDGSALHGWMDGGWWRTPSEPHNARVMEQVATLAWFFANDRPWNPYYADAALEARLSAAIDYYLGLQHPDGSFPEYEPSEHSLAATGFGTVALAHALADMQTAGLDATRLARMQDALGASSTWLLNATRGFWQHPLPNGNQTAAGLVGASLAAEVLGDAALMTTVRDRVALLGANGQAPGGWFYETGGFDSGYNWGVQLPDLGELHSRIGEAGLVSQASLWADFFSYTAVREPGAPGFVRMAAASSRTDSTAPVLDGLDDAVDKWAFANEFLDAQPVLAAFRPSREDVAASRAAWAAATEPVPARAKGDTSPRLWMHIPHAPQGPTAAEKAAQIAALPVMTSSRFTVTRASTVNDMRFLFTRRPGYYAAALYGQRATERVRNGVQLVWHPVMGTFVLGLNVNSPDDSWGTAVDGVGNDARATMTPAFSDGSGAPVDPSVLESVTGELRVHATMPSGGIASTVTLLDDRIVREVTAVGSGRELVPLLLQPGDDLEFIGSSSPVTWNTTASTTATGFRIVRNGVEARLSWGTSLAVSLTPTSRTLFADAARRQHILRVQHAGAVTTELVFTP